MACVIFYSEQPPKRINMLRSIALRNAREPMSTTILTQPGVSFRAGPQVEEVVGCGSLRLGARCFLPLHIRLQCFSVIRAGTD
jgi:hypothetical protein